MTNERSGGITNGHDLLCACHALLRAEADGRKRDGRDGSVYSRQFGELAPLLRAFMREHGEALEDLPVPCLLCEDGIFEHIVPGSESETDYSFCTCALGREVEAEHRDALEAKGEERERERREYGR